MTDRRPDILPDKAELRQTAALRRRQAGPIDALALIAAFDQLPVRAGLAVAGYWPMGDEADLRPLLDMLFQRGHVIGLPVVVAKAAPLLFRRWSPGMAMEAGPHKTAHPPAAAGDMVPDLLLIPLLAFDGQGGRLGYGGGFYDRTLDALRREGRPVVAVGVGYATQQWPRLPMDAHDQRLDWVITEQGALEMKR